MAIVRDLPIEEYIASDRVSTHKLKTLHRQGPRVFHMQHIAKTLPTKRSADLLFGDYFETFYQRPTEWAKGLANGTYLLQPHDGRTVEGREFKRSHDGKECLPKKEADTFPHMAEALDEHEQLQALIKHPSCEQQVTFTGVIAGVECQSRPDWANLEGCADTNYEPYCVDLKTSDYINDFHRDIFSYLYHIQGAFCSALMAHNGIAAPHYYLAVVEKAISHRAALYRIGNGVMMHGTSWIHDKLRELRMYSIKNEYPRVTQGEILIDEVPRWWT